MYVFVNTYMLRNETVDIELVLLDLKGNVFTEKREGPAILLWLRSGLVMREEAQAGVDHGVS